MVAARVHLRTDVYEADMLPTNLLLAIIYQLDESMIQFYGIYFFFLSILDIMSVNNSVDPYQMSHNSVDPIRCHILLWICTICIPYAFKEMTVEQHENLKSV